MQLDHLSMSCLEIPFKQTFSHAAASRNVTETVLVKAVSKAGLIGYGEGCPRLYVTGETVLSALQFFDSIRPQILSIQHLSDLRHWINLCGVEIDQNPAAWCAIELALLDLLGKESGQSVEALLSLSELTGSFQYTAILGADNLTTYNRRLQQYLQMGFCDFKIKVSGDSARDHEKIILLHAQSPNSPVRLDVNNLWQDVEQAITYLRELNYSFSAVEEPLAVGDYSGCHKISTILKCPIILDESFRYKKQFNDLAEHPQNWIINVRISKMGGLLRSLTIASIARKLGIPLIIGAQVGETSILTRAALTLANAYREQIIAQEGAFGTYLLQHDITDPPMMFGLGGKLEISAYSSKPGFALSYHCN